jgi:hypothetical protein
MESNDREQLQRRLALASRKALEAQLALSRQEAITVRIDRNRREAEPGERILVSLQAMQAAAERNLRDLLSQWQNLNTRGRSRTGNPPLPAPLAETPARPANR